MHPRLVISLLVPALLILSCEDSKNPVEPSAGKPTAGGADLATTMVPGPAPHNPRSQAGMRIFCFDGTTDGGGASGTCRRFEPTRDGAELATETNPNGSYAGVYVGEQRLIRNKLLGQVNELAFSYAGGPPSGGTPRWSIPIDENNDGDRTSGTEEYAFIDANRCNDGDAFVGTVDGDDDATCFIDHKGVAYDNWDAFAGAHPTWRVARRDNGSPAFTFVIIDQPAHYVVWKIDMR